MEKHLKTLEQNVQWIALGLGGVYLLWMVYAYVITPPVTVKLDKSATAPAITPGDVDDTIAKKDAEPLKIAMSRSDALDIKVADVMGPYLARIDEKDLKTPDLATAWGGVRGEVPGVTLEGPGKNVVIAEAPVPPKAVAVASSSNIASIVAANPAAQNSNKVAPAAGQPLPPHTDTGWCSLTFKVPFAELQKAWDVFNNPNVPGFQSLFNTNFLKVTLTRQEMLPNGQWGNETEIPPVGIASTRTFPGAALPNPNAQQRQEAFEYRQWAGSVAQEITQPAFPEVIPGVRVWYAPGQEPPDPTKKQRNGRFGLPPRPPHVGPPPQIPAPQQNQNLGAQGQGAQPGVGQFNVMNLNQDLELMAHDTNAAPGHTYRYRIQYALANPAWESANLAAPKVADQFALMSQPSDWTQPITIPSITQMFVMNVSSQTQRVQFDVFEWKDGKMNRSTVYATPGDTIKDETVVDIRQDEGKRDSSYVLLVGPNGNLSRQDKQAAAANPDYDRLKAEVAVQQDQQASPYGRQQALAR